ncbi:MAG: hypothetical protein KF689_07385 [Gemmatimonadaceae bacterium]|nr:hypothetical protein [Gemmatimonadaceae bacterium]MCW5825008.1 hypothetical protein [Gemmatimonadaceae bacterium]
MTTKPAIIALVAALTLLPDALAAQGGDRQLGGRITRPGRGDAQLPVSGEWVVLHRVGVDAANPIDSMRTRGDGSYAFRYRATGDTNAVYFVSTSRGGVAYFTPPTRERVVQGGMADLVVYDTTSAPIPITVRGRHLIFTAPDSTEPRRSVIEVFELSNDSSRTRVAGAGQRPTFEVALPPGVTQVQGGQGDISPEAVRADDGRVRVWAPLAPGVKQFSFSYDLPVSQTSLSVLLEEAVPVMEVLVEDPRGTAVGGGLVEVDPVQIEGRPFKRFLAQDIVAATEITVTAPGSPRSAGRLRLLFILTAVGAAMLLGLGMAFLRGGPRAFARNRAETPESLALQIAALDAAFERLDAPTESQKAEHYLKRAQLKGRLTAVLAKQDGLA